VPDAVVFMIRVMQPDGVAYEADVLCALRLIARQVDRCATDPTALPIDVVSLSAGYFPETPEERLTLDSFRTEINGLRQRGVTMVAAAGNYATSREFQPAALAKVKTQYEAPLISVGALNPNGTIASFSDQADWVTCYASGVAVVSSFPPVNGSTNPISSVPRYRRQSYDLDDFSGGIAMWNGTSFATPIVAAAFTAALTGLAPGDAADMPARAKRALEKLQE
jgi:subtilisin family serine protease